MIMQAGEYINTALVFADIITIAAAGLVLHAACAGSSSWPTRAGGADAAPRSLLCGRYLSKLP